MREPGIGRIFDVLHEARFELEIPTHG
jgi:hypothetical protein